MTSRWVSMSSLAGAQAIELAASSPCMCSHACGGWRIMQYTQVFTLFCVLMQLLQPLPVSCGALAAGGHGAASSCW